MLYNDYKLIYVYHNQVDARGDHALSENEVFDAVHESINEIDLIITDVNMPRMDGFQFVAELRVMEEYQSLPVLFVTTQEQPADKERGILLGAKSYFVKPTNMENLVAWVRNLIPLPVSKGAK